MDTQHFDINIHSPEENGEFVADFYPLRVTPERTLAASTALPPAKRVDITDVYTEHAIDALCTMDHDPDDAWLGTDSDDLTNLPAALHDLLAETAEALRTAAPDPATRVERPAPVSTAFAYAGIDAAEHVVKVMQAKVYDFRLIEVLALMDGMGVDKIEFTVDFYPTHQTTHGHVINLPRYSASDAPRPLVYEAMNMMPFEHLLPLTDADTVTAFDNVTLTRDALVAHLDTSFPNKEYLA